LVYGASKKTKEAPDHMGWCTATRRAWTRVEKLHSLGKKTKVQSTKRSLGRQWEATAAARKLRGLTDRNHKKAEENPKYERRACERAVEQIRERGEKWVKVGEGKTGFSKASSPI